MHLVHPFLWWCLCTVFATMFMYFVHLDQQCSHTAENSGAHWEAPAGEAADAG